MSVALLYTVRLCHMANSLVGQLPVLSNSVRFHWPLHQAGNRVPSERGIAG